MNSIYYFLLKPKEFVAMVKLQRALDREVDNKLNKLSDNNLIDRIVAGDGYPHAVQFRG